eukprot:TRINITY_DN4772_c0_g2_i1.p1 TRINITY_DN4772_c0_g2~~TRINITY_DN4772_c0_g2_i1.p1  ORF type:complete len:259 (+),score=21.65 TRINITY_DN4772_c0_g2_i1:104-880(+)
MVIKASKMQILRVLRGFLANRVLVRIFLFVLLMAFVPLFQFVWNVDPAELFALNSNDCTLDFNSESNSDFFRGQFLKSLPFYPFNLLGSSSCMPNANFTLNVFREIMDKKLLNSGAKALSIGDQSASAVSALRKLGFSDAYGVNQRSFSSLLRKGFVYQLAFEDGSFDFVFSSDLDRVSVPALLVLEIERVLKPGGAGAVLMGVSSSNPGSLIKTAAPISTFLKNSNVVQVGSIESFTLVIFKKRSNDGQSELPINNE